jgi:hypothetical protein
VHDQLTSRNIITESDLYSLLYKQSFQKELIHLFPLTIQTYTGVEIYILIYLNTFKTVFNSLLPTTAEHACTHTIYRTDISNCVVTHTGHIAMIRQENKVFTLDI